jgi:tRNA(fMet)-specific endonuclease VapC
VGGTGGKRFAGRDQVLTAHRPGSAISSTDSYLSIRPQYFCCRGRLRKPRVDFACELKNFACERKSFRKTSSQAIEIIGPRSGRGSVLRRTARGSAGGAGSAQVLRSMICPDTNVVIRLINRRDPKVRDRLEDQLAIGARIVLPAILPVRTALWLRQEQPPVVVRATTGKPALPRHHYRAVRSRRRRARGRHPAALEAKGMPIGAYDCLIAGQARSRGATLVTANLREFARVPGLLVVDWAM